MDQSITKFSPAIYGIVIICFLLPWVSFTCQDKPVATLTGLQLVTGTEIKQQGMWGQPKNQKIDPEPLAIVVLSLAVIGLALSFIKSKKSAIVPMIVSLAGLIFLFLLKSKIETDATKQTQGAIQVAFEVGFWLTLISFIIAIIINGYFFFDSKKEIQSTFNP